MQLASITVLVVVSVLVQLRGLVWAIPYQNITRDGIDLIMKFETFQPNFYNDQGGVLTVGYGHSCNAGRQTCAGINMPLTQDEATRLLYDDLVPREQSVADTIKVNVPPCAFSAMVSLAYNIGTEAFKASQVAGRVNANDMAGASQAFMSLCLLNGSVLQDLVIRRKAEMSLFCSAGGC